MQYSILDIRCSILESRRAGEPESRLSGSLTFWTHPASSIQYLASIILLCVIIIGCGEESPFESQDSVPTETPGALSALHFPTADGCTWEYISADGSHAYTAKVAGTKNIGGFAAKVVENRLDVSSDIPLDVPVDYLSSLYGFPVHASFFTKDLNSYTEHAFDLWLDVLSDTFFQRNSPKRVLWSFPLYEGKEWIVSKSRFVPEITYTRKVVSSNGVLTVPAGTFENVYCVEEYASIADLPTEEEEPNKYWLAPDVGVIKYEYVDGISMITKTYELTSFKKGH
jgi:hypothetical protein